MAPSRPAPARSPSTPTTISFSPRAAFTQHARRHRRHDLIGETFSGTVDLQANRDLGNEQILDMGPGTSIVTTNTSANAVSLQANSSAGSTDPPGDPIDPDRRRRPDQHHHRRRRHHRGGQQCRRPAAVPHRPASSSSAAAAFSRAEPSPSSPTPPARSHQRPGQHHSYHYLGQLRPLRCRRLRHRSQRRQSQRHRRKPGSHRRRSPTRPVRHSRQRHRPTRSRPPSATTPKADLLCRVRLLPAHLSRRRQRTRRGLDLPWPGDHDHDAAELDSRPAYNQTVTADGGTPPHSYALTAGSLADRPQPRSQQRRDHRHPDRLGGQPVRLHHHRHGRRRQRRQPGLHRRHQPGAEHHHVDVAERHRRPGV